MKKNKFSKALKHLKSKKIDEKIKGLEEAAPTNNMSGVYQVTPSTGDAFRMGVGDPDKKFYPKQDGTWPSGIPANASDTVYIRKGGYYDSGKGAIPDNQTPTSRDFTYDDVTNNGSSNTDTFIRPSDGKPYTSLPPNSESFILGPLVGNYAINHGDDDFTNIGYIQKDTRQFVLLGRIHGFFKGEDRPRTSFGGGHARTFDGTASQFQSFNSNFTLEHALWMQDRYNRGDFADNFPFNFSGGIPVERHPSNSAMGMGVIMGVLNALFGGANDNIGTPQDPADVNDINSLDLMGLIKKGITALGDFAVDPFGSIADFVKNDLVDLYDKFSDTTLSNDVLEPAFEKFGQFIGSKSGFVLGIVTTAANDLRSFIGDKQSQFGDKPAFPTSNNQFAYAINLAMSLAQSIGNGRPVVMDNSVVSSQTIGQNISVNDINMMHETNQTPQNGMPYYGTGVDDILNPNKDGDNKKPYMGDGFGGEGGSILTPYIDNKGNLKLINVADKTLRVGGESGEGFDINTQTFTDIPSSGNAMGIVDEMVNSGKFADGLTNLLNQQTDNDAYNSALVDNITNTVANSPTYQNLMTVLDNDTIGGSFVSGSSTGAVNGAAAGALLYNQIKVKLGIMEPTDLQNAGGFGHVRRETVINVDDLKPEVKNKLNELYNIKESVITESKARILREIRQPLKEIKELPKTQKLKGYKPNFKGKYSPQNTPDVTASKQSDDIVSGKNASRQVWTAKDKYWKAYETTERMNIIYDNLGHGSQFFDRIVDENVRLKSKQTKDVQEHLNMLAHQKAMREVYGIREYENKIDESETYDNKVNDPLFTKVAKRLKKEIDYPKKPAAKGYPNEAPPKIDPNTGYHPKFGKRYKYDKLDPISAKTMAGAPTGDPEIDANVKKAAKIKENWRSDLKNLWLGSEREDWKKKLEEGMTTSDTFSYSVSGKGDVDLTTTGTGYTVDGVNQLQNIEPMTNVDDPHNVGKKLGGGPIGAGYQNAYGARDRFDNANDQAAGIESDNYNQPVTGSGLDNNNNLRYSDYIYPFDRDATPAEDAVAKAASKVRGYNDSFRAVYPTNTSGNRHKSTPVVTNTTVGTDDDYDTAGLGIVYGQGFDNRTPRFFVPNTVDTSEIDTVQILASLSAADSITASGTQLQLFYWSGDRPGFQSLQNKFAHPSADFPSSNRQYDGWRPIAQKPSGEIDSSVSSNLIDIEKPLGYEVGKVSKFSIQIPEWVRSKSTRFMLIQMNASGSRDNLVLYSIGYQRRNAITINTTLADEKASAYVRVGNNSQLSPEERKKKLNDMLEASRQYMLKSLGFASLFNNEVKISDVVSSNLDFTSVMQGSGKFGNARFHDIIDADKNRAAQKRATRSAKQRSSATAYKRSFR